MRTQRALCSPFYSLIGLSFPYVPSCCGPMQVLSDKEKRQIYDQFGEEGLKAGGPTAGGFGGGANGFPGGGFHFTARNPNDIFREVCVHVPCVFGLCFSVCRGG